MANNIIIGGRSGGKMKAMFNEASRGRIQELGEENERLKTELADALQLVQSWQMEVAGRDADIERHEREIFTLRAENERLKAINEDIGYTLTHGCMKYNEDGTSVINKCPIMKEIEKLKHELAVRERAMEILMEECWVSDVIIDRALSQARAEIAKEEKPEPERDSTLSQAHVVSYGKEPEVKP